jgi:hypothetical protein
MQASEMRIGNYAIREGVVVQLDGRSIMDAESGTVSYEAIPITQEWLVRLGFNEFSRDMGRIIFRHDKDMLMLEFIKGICWFVFNNEILSNEIKAVHQIQNLFFALTDEELKIKY